MDKIIFPKIDQLLFADIETAREYKYYQKSDAEPDTDDSLIFEIADPRGYDLFYHKYHKWKNRSDMHMIKTAGDFYYQKAGLFPEYSKIVCIVICFVSDDKIRMKRFYGHDERTVIADFIKTIEADWFFHNVMVEDYKVIKKLANQKKDKDVLFETLTGVKRYIWDTKMQVWRIRKPKLLLCGHSLKDFDMPFVYKRCIINGFFPPSIISHALTPTYEQDCIDTKKIFNHKSYSGFVSLDELTHLLNIPSPKKGVVKGSEVSDCYWATGEKYGGTDREENLISIVDYCERDTKSLVDIVEKMNNLTVIDSETNIKELLNETT